MAILCRKQFIQLLSMLGVAVFSLTILRHLILDDDGITANLQILTEKVSHKNEHKIARAQPLFAQIKPNSTQIINLGQFHKQRPGFENANISMLWENLQRKTWDRSGLGDPGRLKDAKHAFDQTENLSYSMDETHIDRLTADLRDKLEKVSEADVEPHSRETCSSSQKIGNSCAASGCLRLTLPRQLRTRVEQIVLQDHLQLNAKYQAVLSTMAAEIPHYSEVVMVSAVSSNHYLESQAMLYNLHHNVFPHLKNFTFIYYNLGLLPAERRYLANICRCLMIDFPYHLFPNFLSYLKCYTWKPLIVNAVIQRAELVFWVDASIRFKQDPAHLMSLLERAKNRGVQMGWSKTTISKTTLPSMFHFFGDEACAYVSYNQGLSGVVIYHNEWMIRRMVLQPWAACALSGQCMCPQTGVDLFQARITCHQDRGKYFYGICHRFDQSALSILLTKLYQDHVDHIILRDIEQFLDIKRGDERPYAIPPKE